MTNRSLFAHCIAGSLAMFTAFSIFADDGKARYVSGSGSDVGDCQNKFRPCRTLSYATARAGKSDVLWVAEGEYFVRDTIQLTELMSINGRVRAGYDKHTGFTDRNATEKTLLIGVPPQLRERYEKAGFSVIADTKGLTNSPEESLRMKSYANSVAAMEKSHAAAPCASGQSSGFPCQGISLHSHMPFSQLQPASTRGADLWGFTDLNNGREYVVLGLDNGVAVVDVTDPTAPSQVAYAGGTNTTWREVTIYQAYDSGAKRWRAYAYVTADGNVSDRLLVLDLSGLPNSIERVNFVSDFNAAHTDYLVNADYTFGIAESAGGAQLVVSGARATSNGNYRLYSLAQPRSPQFLNRGSLGYAHDVASFGVADARKNAQCVNAASAAKCQVLADFNETTVDVWDVTNPNSPSLLAQRSYANAAYVHSGWWTEDGRYLYVHDELDEQDFGLGAVVRIFDMSNLAAPSLVGNWTSSNRAIDHNGYARGNRYYFSNYSEGLTVLDTTNPIAPSRVGFFDTFPASSQTAFVGAWGAYPFFASGLIAVSDINSGLYLLRNDSLAASQGTIAFLTPSVQGVEGGSVLLTLSRTGGSGGAVSVQLDFLHATSSADDIVLPSQTIAWADGDSSPKSVTVALTADNQAEQQELLLVRLKNPQGGATINYPDTAFVRIAEPGATTRLRPLDSAISVNQVRGRVYVTVARGGTTSGAASVDYATATSGGYSSFTSTQGKLSWGDGDAEAKTIAIDLSTNGLPAGQSGTFQVQLSGASNADLEDSAGAIAATTAVNVTVVDTTSPPVTPTPTPTPSTPPSGSGGGGSLGEGLLALLLVSLGFQKRRRESLRQGGETSARRFARKSEPLTAHAAERGALGSVVLQSRRLAVSARALLLP